MKQNYVSGLGILLCFPVFAGARLPAVNVAAGAVSARAQYGVPVPVTVNASNDVVNTVVSNKVAPSTRRVVARVSTRNNTPSVAPANVSRDSDAKIAMSSDVLNPNRPSSDLWAKNDTPLRMPHADEFSVITPDFILPEENIASAPTVVAHNNTEINNLSSHASALDAQIAQLMDARNRATISVQKRRVAPIPSAPVAQNVPNVETAIYSSNDAMVNIANTNRQIADIAPVADIATREVNVHDNTVARATDSDVQITRMVVPRDEVGVSNTVSRVSTRDVASHQIQAVREDMTKMSPSELRRAFRKTFLSENKHLSTYPIDDRFDVASDMGTSIEGFTSARDLSEDYEKIRPLEIKIKFRNTDSSLSRDNYNLLAEYAGIVVANPKRAIQVAIPVAVTTSSDVRKLAAKRLAIIEQVLRDTGVSEQRIVPVLSERNEEGFVLRIISNEQYESLTKQKRNMFGDTVGSKTYKSMTW